MSHIILVLTLFYTNLGSATQLETCQAGIGTKYDGFQETFVQSTYFEDASFYYFKSPFMRLKQNYDISDLHISLWVKFESVNQLNGTLFKCQDGSNSQASSLSLSMQNSSNLQQLGLQLMGQQVGINIGDQISQNAFAADAWNYYQIFANSNVLELHVNDLIQSIAAQQTNLASQFFSNLKSSSESIVMCGLGTDNFRGYMRYLQFSNGLFDSLKYRQLYMHSQPTPLDPYLIAFFSLENYLGNSFLEDVNNSDQQSQLSFSESNEPDFICACEMLDQQYPLEGSANYAFLNDRSTLNSILIREPQALVAQVLSSLEIKFSLFIEDISSVKQLNLLSHNTLWNLTIFNKTQLGLTVGGLSYAFNFSDSGGKHDDSLVYNHWLEYTIALTSSNKIDVTVSDFSRTLKLSTITLASPFNPILTSDMFKQGTFVVDSASKQFLLRQIHYTVNDYLVLDFNFTKKKFIHSSDDTITINDKDGIRQVYLGYFYSSFSATVGGEIQDFAIATNNLQFKQVRPPCNQSDSAFGFDGLVCKNSQRYAFFNKASDLGAGGYFQAFVPSTSSYFTFESWIKFTDFNNAEQQRAVVISNYQQLSTPLIVVSINRRNETLQLECIPYYSASHIPGYLDSAVVDDSIVKNEWIHIACVSNGEVDSQWLKVYAYHHKSEILFQNSTMGSHTISLPSGQSIRTVLGNSLIDQNIETTLFQGFIREVKLWSVAKSDQNLSLLRYQTLSANQYSNLLVYLQLGNGYGTRVQNISHSQYQQTEFFTHSKLNAMAYAVDSELQICPPGTIFVKTSSCCVKDDFTIDLTKQFSENNNGNNLMQLSASIQYVYSNQEPVIGQDFQISWNLDSAESSQSTTTPSNIAQIKSLLDQSSSQQLTSVSIDESLLSVEYTYNFLFSAKKIQRNQNITISRNMYITPSCPSIELKPSYNSDHVVRFSEFMNPSKLILQLNLNTNCKIPPQNEIISWTTTNIGSSYYKTYDSNYSLNFLQFPQNFEPIKVSSVYSYKQNGQNLQLQDYQTIEFSSTPLTLLVKDFPERISLSSAYYLMIDLSSSQVNVDYFPTNDLKFSITCPRALFKTQLQQDTLCIIDQATQLVRIPLSGLKIVNSAEYSFNVVMSSAFLNYSESLTLFTSFYSPKYNACPLIQFSSYFYFSRIQEIYLLAPTYNLDCTQTINAKDSDPVVSHSITYIKWSVDQYSDPIQFLALNSDSMFAQVKDSVRDKLDPGFSTQIQLSIQIDGLQWFNFTTTALVQKSQIEVIDSTNIQNGQISFEQLLQIDASSSFDPDYPKNQLQFSWLYNNKNLSLKTYAQSLKMTMNPFERLDLDMSILSTSHLVLDVLSPSYPDSEFKKSYSFAIQPYSTTSKSSFEGCQLTFDQDFSNLKFSFSNATDLQFTAKLDPNACSSLKPITSKFYVFLPDQDYSYFQTSSYQVSKSYIAAMKVTQTKRIDFVLLFSHQTSLWMDYNYIVNSLTIQRVSSLPVVVFVTGSTQTVGLEETIVLNASLSYDPDSDLQLNKRFYWSCPANLESVCTSSSGPLLSLTKADRANAQLNALGVIFQLSVQVSINGKMSDDSDVTITVVAQNYSGCFSYSLSASDGVASVKRDQVFPYQVKIYPKYLCDDVQIQSISWTSTTQGVSKFWMNDMDSQSLIIKSSLSLPTNQSSISFNVNVTYSGRKWASDFSILKKFTLEILPSDIVVVLKSSDKILNPSKTQLQLSLAQSYNPDDSKSNLTSFFICPHPLVSQEQCDSFTKDGEFIIPAGTLSFADDFQTYEFSGVVAFQYQNFAKKIFITLVQNSIQERFPLCSIETNKFGEFLLDDLTVFYPSCKFSGDKAIQQSNYSASKYLWTLSTFGKVLSYSSYSVSLKPFEVFSLFNTHGITVIAVTLSVYTEAAASSEQKGYQIRQEFEVANYTLSRDQNAKLIISPNSGFAIFSQFAAEIQNYELDDDQFFRVRVGLTDGSYEVLLNQAYNYSYVLNLPKNTKLLIVDIVKVQTTSSSSYQVTVLNVSVTTNELQLMTLTAFNQLVLPQILQDVQISDFSDLAQIQLELNKYFGLMQAISRVNNYDLQQNYIASLLKKYFVVMDGIQFYYFDDDQLLLVRTLLLKVASLAYQKIQSSNFTYLDNLQNAFQNELITSNIMSQLSDLSYNNKYLNEYINNIYQLLTVPFIPLKIQDFLELRFYQLLSTQLVQGQLKAFDSIELNGSKTTLYRLKDVDLLGLQPFTIPSPFATSDSSYISIYGNQLPENSFQLLIKHSPSQSINNFQDLNKNYTASRTGVQVQIYDSHFKKINFTQVQAKVTFQIQQTLKSTLEYIDKKSGLMFCISKEDDDGSSTGFNYSDTTLSVDISSLSEGFVTCNSPHLSTFDLIYKPRVDYYVVDYEPYQNSTVTVFQKMPILKFVIPSAYLVFMLTMIGLAKLLESLESHRPQRYYNKLSVDENIRKHSLARLFGAITLQFNPFLNYFIKQNYYLPRKIRLLMLNNYFLLISAESVLIFVGLPEQTHFVFIFVVSVATNLLISVARPRIQNVLFSLFYPKSIKKWRYQTGFNQNEGQSMLKGEQQQNMHEEILNQSGFVDQSQRLKDSMNRMLGQYQDVSQIVRMNTAQQIQEDFVKGDEILNYRKAKSLKKQQRDLRTSNKIDLHQSSELYKMTKKKGAKRKNSSNLDKMDIEMQEFTPTQKLNQDSVNELEKSKPQTQEGFPELQAQSLHYSGLDKAEEGIQVHALDEEPELKINKQIIVQLESSQVEINLDEEEEDLQIVIGQEMQNEQIYEGGEDDQVEQVKQSKPKKIMPKKKSKQNQDPTLKEESKESFTKKQYKVRNGKIGEFDDHEHQIDHRSSQLNEESTPSLEGLFENYRTLDRQQVPLIRKLMGTCLLLLCCFSLWSVHIVLMPQMQEKQFQNWFSCTLFTFIIQIFVVDSLIYWAVAWNLKQYGVGRGARIEGCTRFNTCVMFPLGKYKYEELEIELAKLKDFDQEYNLLKYL